MMIGHGAVSGRRRWGFVLAGSCQCLGAVQILDIGTDGLLRNTKHFSYFCLVVVQKLVKEGEHISRRAIQERCKSATATSESVGVLF
jgi:hypothetical protein